jgi:FkbM family methyltransferase
MIKRPVWFNDLGWRKYIPTTSYCAIHAARFRGANRLRNIFKLQTVDTELWISRAIAKLTLPNTVLLDVGAQHGRHIKYLFAHGSSEASAVACEANPNLVKKLKQNFCREIAADRMTLVEAAIGASNSPIEFFINTEDSGYSGLKPRQIKEVSNSYTRCEMRQVRIDDIADSLHFPVSCIKVDVEGAEMNVFAGALKTIQKDAPVLIFECVNNASPFYGSDLTTVLQWFEKLGYCLNTISGQPISQNEAKHLFDNRLCCDFVAVLRKRQEQVNSFLRQIAFSEE